MDHRAGKLYLFLLIIVLLCFDRIGSAQTEVRVSDPRIELRENIIHISYDLLNSTPSDNFSIGVYVSDNEGSKIYANSLTGDIGKLVSGGKDKHIQWDLEADQIFMDEKIYFEIFAMTVSPPERGFTQNSEPAETGSIGDNFDYGNSAENSSNTTSYGNYVKSYSSFGIVIQSLVIPGLGLSRMTGNPHWLRGLAGYGCLAGSYYLNRQSLITFEGIERYSDFDDKYEQLQKSITQDNISEVLAFTAIGIWLADLIWNVAGITSFNKRSFTGENRGRGIAIRPGIDPLTYAPVVGIKFSF